MMGKGLARRDESRHAHVYEAAVEQEQTQRKLVRDLLANAFEGSVHKLMVQALQASKIPPEQLRQIRQLLDEHGRPHDGNG